MADRREVIDQIGRPVIIERAPKRIISLVPSQTELLFYLGLKDQIVGVTKFCVHPSDQVCDKTIVGGTKKFRFDVIDELKPDLIIGNKEENYEEGINRLTEKYPVWVSDVKNLEDALSMIVAIGKLLNYEKRSRELVDLIRHSLLQFPDFKRSSAVYLIWKKPYMVAGSNTFINDMLKRLNLVNLISDKRYPSIKLEDLSLLKPKFIFLSSEPYPFKGKHLMEFERVCPQSTIALVDGEIFSWYGNRLLKTADYFNELHNRLLN